MNRYFFLTTFAAVALCITGFAAPIPVALLSDEPGAASTDIRNKLLASGLFSVVDYINISTTTPTVLQLQQYASVLVYTGLNAYSSPTALGNNLATYVDGGGGVVQAVFSNASQPMQGRFSMSPYVLITPGGQAMNQPLTLEAIQPTHPILTGVDSFHGGSGSYRSTGGAAPGATTIAVWEDSNSNSVAPLVVVKDIGSARRVDLNFLPPSDAVDSRYWDQGTDGAILLANAVSYSGHGDVIPEPASTILLLSGIGLLCMRRSKRFLQ